METSDVPATLVPPAKAGDQLPELPTADDKLQPHAKAPNWRFNKTEFAIISGVAGPFTLDACANPTTALTPDFCDEHTSPLDRDWKGHRVWCHPPWHLVRQVVEHYQKCKSKDPANTSAVFVIPAYHNFVQLCAPFKLLRGYLPGARLFTNPTGPYPNNLIAVDKPYMVYWDPPLGQTLDIHPVLGCMPSELHEEDAAEGSGGEVDPDQSPPDFSAPAGPKDTYDPLSLHAKKKPEKSVSFHLAEEPPCPTSSLRANLTKVVERIVAGADLYILDGEVNGHPVTCLLDTGADHNFISWSRAERLGINVSGPGGCTLSAFDGRSSSKLGFCSPVELQLGELKVELKPVAADLAIFDLYIGTPFVDKFEPRIRRSKNEVILYPADREPISLPLRRPPPRKPPSMCSYIEFIEEIQDAEEIFVGFVSCAPGGSAQLKDLTPVRDDSGRIYSYVINSTQLDLPDLLEVPDDEDKGYA